MVVLKRRLRLKEEEKKGEGRDGRRDPSKDSEHVLCKQTQPPH